MVIAGGGKEADIPCTKRSAVSCFLGCWIHSRESFTRQHGSMDGLGTVKTMRMHRFAVGIGSSCRCQG